MATGWIERNTNETLANFLIRLANSLHAYVKVSMRSGSTIAYSADGLILRQRETVTTTEIRGLSESAANFLMDVQSDNTASVLYYHLIDDTGDYAMARLTSGTKTNVSSQRVNEAAGWRVTVEGIEYTAEDASGWTTSRPSPLDARGRLQDDGVLLGSARSTLQPIVKISTGYGGVCSMLCVNCITDTIEYRYLTKEQADGVVAALIDKSDVYAHKYTHNYFGGSTTAYLKNGTVYAASAHYVDGERGWTVSCEKRTYSVAAFYAGEVTYYWTDEDGNALAKQVIAAPFCECTFGGDNTFCSLQLSGNINASKTAFATSGTSTFM